MVTPASTQDRDGLPELLHDGKADCSRIATVLVDGAYTGSIVKKAERDTGVTVTMVKRPDVKYFVVVPKRWIVERTFGWMNRDRRLSKEYERTIASSESRIYISAISRMTRAISS